MTPVLRSVGRVGHKAGVISSAKAAYSTEPFKGAPALSTWSAVPLMPTYLSVDLLKASGSNPEPA